MKIVAGTATDLEPAPSARPSPRSPGMKTGPELAEQAANVRLVIEEDAQSGSFIYKTVDRTTGEVILQLPREEVLKAVMTGAYTAGDVVKARA